MFNKTSVSKHTVQKLLVFRPCRKAGQQVKPDLMQEQVTLAVG